MGRPTRAKRTSSRLIGATRLLRYPPPLSGAGKPPGLYLSVFHYGWVSSQSQWAKTLVAIVQYSLVTYGVFPETGGGDLIAPTSDGEPVHKLSLQFVAGFTIFSQHVGRPSRGAAAKSAMLS